MRILLDTHIWLWLNGAVERLSSAARGILVDPGNELYLSVASSWEIGIKYSMGKLRLPEAPERYLPSRLTRNGARPLPIQQAHALRAASLPLLHRDPFDRMLVAQAQLEEMKLMSADPALAGYEVELLAGS